ncbi:MAG: tyrosine-type recombinase/integrase [Longimicrobiales bacterium]|nr:tyrosine-type recombinase/integrase [Longimicrobiales bacterium]
MAKRKKKRAAPATWSYSVGEYGAKVRAYEREPGGILYGCVPNVGGRGYVRASLGHRDRERAEQWALSQSQKLRAGVTELETGRVTLATVFALYARHATPQKSERVQREDARRREMWARVLGGTLDPSRITRSRWEAFARERVAGAIDCRGFRSGHPEHQPGQASPRTLEADQRWLRAVLTWATSWTIEATGRPLLDSNPVRGFPVQTERNPARPVMTDTRYEKLLAVAGQVEREFTREGRRRTERTYLRELLILAHETGRRITPICKLRWSDIQWERSETRPHGAIAWPGQTDKQGREWTAPITAAVRHALEEHRQRHPGVGDALLFPSPRDASRPITKDTALKWLREAEERAELGTEARMTWHAIRRAWATARKHHADADVAQAGGWGDTRSLQLCYQAADEATTLRVILDPARLEAAQ